MSVLVTGASGRIGRNLCQALRDRGAQVRALVLPEDSYRGVLEEMGVECTTGNLEDYASVLPVVQGVEVVYHLGALLPQRVNAFQLFEANLRGTFYLLQALVETGNAASLNRFIFASTDATYPSGKHLYLPIDETHPQQPTSFYGFTKEAGERMCLTYARQFSIPLIRPRFTFTIEARELLDPRSVAGPLFFLDARIEQLQAAAKQGHPGVADAVDILQSLQQPGQTQLLIAYGADGTPERMTLCDVRDLVSGLLLLLSEPAALGETFNLGPPSAFTLDRAVKYIAALLDLPFVEARLPLDPMCFEVSSARARAILDYRPTIDIFEMIRTAAETRSPAGVRLDRDSVG